MRRAALSTDALAPRLAAIALVAFAYALDAQTPAPTMPGEPPRNSLAITGVSVVDVASGGILPNSTVLIHGEAIASVSRNAAPPVNARVVDGRGKYLIPGLWDMHAHMEGSGEAWLELYVANGVTGIRDMGSDLDFILPLRDATASGRIVGPRIIAAGPILDDAPEAWPFRMRVRDAEEGRAAVRLLKRRGVDLIKVHNLTPRDAFFAIAGEARRQNLPVAGHVPSDVTIEEAIDAGLTSIEHLAEFRLWTSCSAGTDYRPEACRAFFAMLARRGIWQTPTLVAMSEILAIGTPASTVSAERLVYATRSIRELWAGNQREFATPERIQRLRTLAQVSAVVTSDMAKAGVRILAGCDAMIAGFCVHDELVAMVRGGMTPLAALQTATINPALYLGRDKALGTVAPTRIADLVLLDGNPLEDIANVRRIRAVVIRGRILERPELDRILTHAKLVAQQ